MPLAFFVLTQYRRVTDGQTRSDLYNPRQHSVARVKMPLRNTQVELCSLAEKMRNQSSQKNEVEYNCCLSTCQKLLQFDVHTTLTILIYRHSFSSCCVQNLRNPKKFFENSNLQSSRSSKIIDLGVNRKGICNFLLVINSNFGRISHSFRGTDTFSYKIAYFPQPSIV